MAEAERASLRGAYAGFVSRLAAFLLDATIITVISITVSWCFIVLLEYVDIDVRDCPSKVDYPLRGWICHLFLVAAPLVSTLFGGAYEILFWTATGQTPGKAVMGLRVVRLDGGPVKLVTAVRRSIGYAVSMFTLGLGFLAILSDNRRQGWHDKIAGTLVVYAWDAQEHAGMADWQKRNAPPGP